MRISEAQTSSHATLTWEMQDRYAWLTLISLGGVLATVALAVVGLPTIDLHGPLHRMGIMDPFCGGTRSAWLTTQGRLGDAWRYNPLGIAAVAAAFLVLARTVIGFATQRWLTLRWRPSVRMRWGLVLLGVALLAVLEVRQQGRAELLSSVTVR